MMMNKVFKTAACLLICVAAYGKEEPKYPVSAIPEEMKTGMYAVIRDQEMRFEITSISSATTYYRVVITILNAKAKEYASMAIGYDKFKSVKSFKGTAYDSEGNILKRLKQSEIYDQSAFDGYSLFSDNRVKHGDLSQGIYPYTVEFGYETAEKRLYGIPDFYLYKDDEVSIQKSLYSLLYEPSLKPRYKLFKIKAPLITKVEGKEMLVWSFENIIPNKFEILDPDMNHVVPNISAAPGRFEYDGYAGDMSTWEEYGKWEALLLKGRDNLPEATKQKVKQLTSGLNNIEDKTKALYEYLQSKTRYVSISLGIGGLQPFDASVVDETGYGDCKALSNYMVAMLKEAGIKAYYSSVMAGENAPEVDVDFPSHQSNHVIVAVPNGADTLWLECTSQTSPFNYQGRFTGDRKALMITESGGKLVHTHRYPAEQNLQVRSADVYVDATGDAKAKVKTMYKGIQYENDNLDFILNSQYDEQKKWLQKNVQIPAFDISNFKMVNNKNKIPSAIVEADLVLKRFASVSGKRIFVSPNLMNRSTFLPEKTEERKTDIVVKWGWLDNDTIRYHIPESIYPEFLPEPVKIISRFGEYEASFKIEQGNVLYFRRLKMNNGRFPASSYKEFYDFYRSINKADNVKIVFLNKT